MRRSLPPIAERKRRFLREAKAASALSHPNIVTIYDFGTDGKIDYLVMEYVPGKPLDRVIPPDGLTLKTALHYASQIADALACAHAAGIIHRDLKAGQCHHHRERHGKGARFRRGEADGARGHAD